MEGDGGDAAFYETVLENDLGDKAVLHFSLFDEEGLPYTYEGSVAFRQRAARWQSTLWNRKKRTDVVVDPVTFQYQQLVHTNSEPSEEEMRELRRLFLVGRRQIWNQSQGVLESIRGGIEESSREVLE